MADTLKFGPEWLRALSDGNSGSSGNTVTSPPPSPGILKYKLAEHRYGREEMLGLYFTNDKIPEPLREFQSILCEKPVQALAFIPYSEEEQRLMSQSVNSTAVLRLMGRGAGPSGPPLRGTSRGGAAGDRGRGRGRGRGEGLFQRGTSFDGDEGFGRGRHGRGEGWEDVRDKRFLERSMPGRTPYEEGPTSPRRDYSRSMSSDNWREARAKEGERGKEETDDDGDWRRAGPRDKWGTRGSWREPRERGGFDYERSAGGRGGFDDYVQARERTYSNNADALPDWCMDDDEGVLGTFDSSGAFMTFKEAKEKEFSRDRPGAEKERDSKREDSKQTNGAEIEKVRDEENTSRGSSSRRQGSEPHDNGIDKRPSSKSPPPQPVSQQTIKENQQSSTPPVRHQSKSPTSQAVPLPVAAVAESVVTAPSPTLPKEEKKSTKEPVEDDAARKKRLEEEAAAARVAQVLSGVGLPPPGTSGRLPQMPQMQGHLPSPQEDNFEHLEKAAEDLVATWTAEEDMKSDKKAAVERGSVPVDHEDAYNWFYRDPQGDLQGPFTSQEMAEWFTAGYFTMTLLVKRGCDEMFHPLGELIKRWARVPFLPGPPPPPMKNTSPPVTSTGVNIVPPTTAVPGIPSQAVPPVNLQQEQLKIIQQQMLLQQQLFLRQMQMQQVLQTLQTQEGFSKLSVAQQQQLALQLLMKQPATNPLIPPQQPIQQTQNLSPRSTPTEGAAVGGGHPAFHRSVSQPNDPAVVNFHRTSSAPTMDDPTAMWAQQVAQQMASQQQQAAPRQQTQSPNPPTSGGWTQPTSVWDIETPTTQSLEEIQRMERLEIERHQREAVEREAEARKKQEEERARQLEEERRRQLEKEEEERQKQIEIERETERIRMEQLRREAEEARKREEEERLRREEEERRRAEEMKRIQEEQQRREQEEQRRRDAEDARRREIEEQRRREQEEMERKRQDEIRRRQEKAEEMRRQQQEALRRIQQEQLANMQLPASAQWATSPPSSSSGSSLSLSEIQQMEAEKARKEQDEKHRQLEIQRQQLAAIQQQQQQASKTWAAHTNATVTRKTSSKTPSLMEIQEEQARQLELEKQRQQQTKQVTQNLPLATAAVWGSSSPGTQGGSNWAAEGAWARAASQGFWDDAVSANPSPPKQNNNNNKKQNNVNNSAFPALGGNQAPQQTSSSKKSKAAKTKTEEETVQRLFQNLKPKDDFTQWCETALAVLESSVDVPTFVAFLQDVESPYEVHDYVRSYLGETRDAVEFARQFLEKRSKYKASCRQQKNEEEMWGPAPAVNPGQNKHMQTASISHHDEEAFMDDPKTKKKKKRMQKVDSTLLGFTVQAAPDRINIGEIEPVETA